ncbi:MAG: DUF697 domain-containing protein [Bacteroidia bacterium]|nr:DUF697 domain-containing protein [Bacteroidia bacterium]MDW8157814.1 DUF697 domain-containing protein [Bacteroidia bacterium]
MPAAGSEAGPLQLIITSPQLKTANPKIFTFISQNCRPKYRKIHKIQVFFCSPPCLTICFRIRKNIYLKSSTINKIMGQGAKEIIQNYVLLSMGAGAIPLPLLDTVALTGVQVKMMNALAKYYGKEPYPENQSKQFITALAGGVFTTLGASAIKMIPGIGTLLGGVSMIILAGATTFAIGQVLCKHFESGGDFSNLNAENFKEYFQEQLEIGKKFAQNIKKEGKNPTSQSSTSVPEDDLIARIKELAELRDSGIITETEFQKLKNEIISRY